MQASNFIQAIEERQGLKVACLEEIAYRMGYITAADLARLARAMETSAYGQYLLRMLEQEAVSVRFVPTAICPASLVIEPDVHRDGRGFFLETYHADKYRARRHRRAVRAGQPLALVAGTLRGLHLQLRRPQGKLIRVIEGEIFDVAVDVRRGSPTFGRWVGVTLSAENFRQCYVPPGFAHGFCVVEPDRAGRVQVHATSTTRRARSASPGTIRRSAIAWPVSEPAAVRSRPPAPDARRGRWTACRCPTRQICNRTHEVVAAVARRDPSERPYFPRKTRRHAACA